MPQTYERNQTREFPPIQEENYYSSNINKEEIDYPEQRSDDLGETSVHANLINVLTSILKSFFKERTDVFITSNMNLYYEEGNPNKWYAPDLLTAFGAGNHERSSYQVWKEKIFPQVIFEVASGRTWKDDISAKYEVYELSGVEEYYIFDPEFAFLPAPLLAFQRQNGRLVSVSIDDDKIFSPRLGLEIVRTENSFRLFNPQTNEFLLTLSETNEALKTIEAEKIKNELRAISAESEVEKLKAEIDRLKSQK